MIERTLLNDAVFQVFEEDASYGMGGKLPFYTLMGSYPIFYVDGENNALCAHCANKAVAFADELVADAKAEGEEEDAFVYLPDLPTMSAVNYESLLYCDQCGEQIEAAYNVVED